MLPSAEEIVAHYLRSHGYNKTLDSFITEAGLEPDVGSGSAITVEQILQEKKTFDLSLRFEKLGTDDEEARWRTPAPSQPTTLDTLPTKSNIISVHMLDLMLPGRASPKRCIAATTADRRLELLDPMLPSFPLLQSNAQIQDSPLLDLVVLYDRYMLAGSMSGRLILYDAATDQITDQRKDHSKYLVKIATWPEEEGTLIATAGWDSKVHIYRLTISAGVAQLGEPLSPLTLQSIPETVLFIQGPGHSSPLLVLSRRDSTFLYYYALSTPPAGPFDISLLGKQNLAPHSNAWVAFSPADVQLCPSDSSIAAVATSSTPHMKLLVVRLLVPPSRQSTTHSVTDPGQDLANSSGRNTGLSDTATPPATQAAQARAELLIQDREEAAILLNINTMSPQTAYSTPKLAWRPDGSGIYVTSDDGVIRGFEASTGKHIATLTAHEPATKVRCLWAGSLEGDVDNGKECLISGGFDRRLILWRTG